MCRQNRFHFQKGGSGSDAFSMYTGGQITGAINGGGGTNTLDYSHDSANVVADLLLGYAGGVSGISNIHNVKGELGTNVLVGDRFADVLTGGVGANILIAESHASTLIGGAGSDILIGGTTSYDSNLTALNSLMSEWPRTDETTAQKIAHIENGGGKNGTTELNASTVHSNGGGNTLTGLGSGELYFGSLTKDTGDWSTELNGVFVGV